MPNACYQEDKNYFVFTDTLIVIFRLRYSNFSGFYYRKKLISVRRINIDSCDLLAIDNGNFS
jgi:hypothetical protein